MKKPTHDAWVRNVEARQRNVAFARMWTLSAILVFLVVFVPRGVSAQDNEYKGSIPIYRIGNGVSAPRAVYTPDPEYSEEARKANCGGEVVLWLIVGADGKTHDVKIARPFGLGLDEKAVEAVRQWKFEPGRKDGQPVATQVNVEVNFRLSKMNVLQTDTLSDIKGLHFGSYLAITAHDVQLNWCKLIPQETRETTEVTIQFSILKDGEVAEIQVSSPSGNYSLDHAALDAINASAPFKPLPSEFGGDHIGLRMHFLYNSASETIFHRSTGSDNR